MSTALIAESLSGDPGFEPVGLVPAGALNASLFTDRGVGVEEFELGGRTIRGLRQAAGVAGYVRALPGLIDATARAGAHLSRHRADIVHVNDDRSLLPWGLAARRRRIPVIWHIRQERPSPVLDALRLRLADHLIFVAEANRVRFRNRRGLPPSSTIHNWVDTSLFYPPADRAHAKAKAGFEPDTLLLGFVGNLVPRKRPEWAIEAVRHLAVSGVRVQLAVVGEDYSGGDHLDRLKRLISDYGLEPRVRLLGYRDDVPDLMRAFDILLLTSVPGGEAFPRSVIEAMASGAAVVATDVAGVREAIPEESHGRLGHPRDLERFLEALMPLVNDPELRRAVQAAAAERARREFGPSTAHERLTKIYRDLLAR